jgi:ABC-type transporter MlaC component
MTDHTIEAHFQVDSSAVAAKQSQEAAAMIKQAAVVQNFVVDRMANAVLGDSVGQSQHAHVIARAKATETYVMVLSMLSALAELGVVQFKVE